MLKKLTFFICFIFLLQYTFSQNTDYYVIKVQGEIVKAADNQPLRSGLSVSENDEFLFKSNISRAAVINPSRGQFVLSPPEDYSSSGSKALFMPPIQNISSRAGGTMFNKIDFQNHFKDDYLILNEVKIHVDTNSYPLNAKQFFYVNYAHEGEPINKKLSSDIDSLVLAKSELFKVDGEPIEAPEQVQLKLFYMNKDEASLICDFMANFPDENQLIKELNNMKEFLDDTSKFKSLAYDFIHEFYGELAQEDFNTFMKHFE